MRQADSSSRLGVNGRAVKMVPASEVSPSKNKVEVVNGTKQVVNGASLVRRNASPGLVKTQKSRPTKELPPMEELKVLPSDEGFSWANENYNSWQRNADVWSFTGACSIGQCKMVICRRIHRR